MKRHILYLIATATFFSACIVAGTLYTDEIAKNITITTNKEGTVSLVITGSGEITVEWGDGAKYSGTISSDMNPIEHFYSGVNSNTITITGDNIRRFDCYNNQITSLELGKNSALTELFCNNNQLTNLNLGNNTALKTLNCSNNKLTTLYVDKHTNLTDLLCNNNQLVGLNVTANTNLTILNCSNNKLTLLNVQQNSSLLKLYCQSNNLSSGALNDIFENLHNNSISDPDWGGKTVKIGNNPGTDDCNKTIATNKGWEVEYD